MRKSISPKTGELIFTAIQSSVDHFIDYPMNDVILNQTYLTTRNYVWRQMSGWVAEAVDSVEIELMQQKLREYEY
jgi:hypothetical protein